MFIQTTSFNDIISKDRDIETHHERPSLTGILNTDREIYAELKAELQKTNFFKPDPLAYIFRGSWVIILGVVSYIFLLTQPELLFRIIAAAILGFTCVQGAAVAHEAAHGAVTKNRKHERYIGLVFMNLIFGSSFAFWKNKHNQHHKKPNSGADPDIRPGLFNFTYTDAKNVRGIARSITSYQHILIWPLSMLMGFMFKIGSIRFLNENNFTHKADVVVLVVHYILWLIPAVILLGAGDALLNYGLVTLFAGIHLSFIFITNHLGNPAYEDCDSNMGFLRQAATARNTNSSFILTSLCNGLNSHIEHHLFPYVPFSRLSSGRKITRQVLEKYGVRYHQTSWWYAFYECYTHLKKMAVTAQQGYRA